MQIQFDDIDSGKGVLWQVGKEEFVHNARTRDSNGTLLFRGWMGCHDYAVQRTFLPALLGCQDSRKGYVPPGFQGAVGSDQEAGADGPGPADD